MKEVTPNDIVSLIVEQFQGVFGPDSALAWFDWFLAQNLALVSCDDEGISGLAVFRPVSEIPGEDDFYTVDEAGSIFWIELLTLKAPGLETRKTLTYPERFLWQFFKDRFDPAQFSKVGWRRRKHGGRVVVKEFPTFYARMLKE